MDELVECLGLRELLDAGGFKGITNFEAIYDEMSSSGETPSLVAEIEQRVLDYFDSLRLPESVNLYDLLLLSLREKDFIASFNWDPFLIQAYLRNGAHAPLPRLAFLHGNVAATACVKDRVKGIYGQRCRVCDLPFPRSRLLYPVKHKNYKADPYIANEWHELEIFMKEAYLLTVFGYAAPSTDIEAVGLMNRIWGENPTFELAQVSIVDIKPREELERTWEPFFCRSHYGIHKTLEHTWSFRYPRRSGEGLAMATLQNAPWKDNPFPSTKALNDLHRWLEPLLEEERMGEFTGTPCPDVK